LHDKIDLPSNQQLFSKLPLKILQQSTMTKALTHANS